MTEPFRRRLTLRGTDDAVDADLEDHIHHVAVHVEHDAAHVTAIEGQGLRLPWSTCPDALALLDELIGAPVGTLPRVHDARAHCTHLLDVARMAIGFAGSGRRERTIDVTVHDWDTPRPRAEIVGHDGSAVAALFLKRALWMAPARGVDLDALHTINQSGIGVGVCHTTQPERYTIARRNRGSSLKELT